jgi:simple sugar transport system ATP-binding protein
MSLFLQLSNISKRFGGVLALQGIDLTLETGEVHCIVGENGSGKSTLIKVITGSMAPSPGGQIIIEGREESRLTPSRSVACGIQVIYQDLSLFPNLTVAENIGIAQHLGGLHAVDWVGMRKNARVAMDKLGVSLDLDATVAQLPISGRQIVAICRAMAADARLLIMDEPTASLSRSEVDVLLQLVRDLKKKGICVIFVSHRLDEVMEVADRVTVLRDGRKLGTFPASEMNSRKLGLLMTGKEFDYVAEKKAVSDGPPCLSVANLSRAGEYADISFELRPGEILGLLGLLGSGRTELALSLFGMTRPDSGEIRVNGRAVKLRSNREAVASGIAYVPEDRLKHGLVLDQPISTNLLLAVFKLVVDRFGMFDRRKTTAVVQQWIHDLTIKVGQPDDAVKTLSGGNQQRVVIGKWLARNPGILILDSPTAGVDIAAKDGIYEVVKRLAASGVAIIMISNEVPEVLYHCNRVLIMRNGRLRGEYQPNISSEQELQEAVNA